MSGNSQLWTSSYERDAEIERLLRDLREEPMTDEQVTRRFLDVVALLTPSERAELEHRMGSGAARLLGFDLRGISDAVGWWLERKQRLQASVEWSQVPQAERVASEQRATSVLGIAHEQGWIERDDGRQRWRLTGAGKAFLAAGGFHMR